MGYNIKSRNKREEETKITRGEDGFTLLEVIMAISVLTIGLLAVASMQVSAIRGNAMSRDYTVTTDRVQDIAEKIYADNFNNVTDGADGDGVGGLNDTGANADYSDTSNPDYTVYWNVANNVAGGSAMTGVNTVRVIVVWQDHGVPKSRSFDFLRTRL